MFPYFTWHEQTRMMPTDQRNAAKMEDLFYAQYGGLPIKARVRNALDVFADRKKSICNVGHLEITTDFSARIFGTVRK